MTGKFSTPETTLLLKALEKRGIKAIPEFWDGHKTVDIAILNAKIFIEVDGLQHYTDAKQIKRDFQRDHYSDGDDFSTIRIPNKLTKDYVEKIADAIAEVIQQRQVLDK
jgi:very-short-patch-repair endonuclease